MTYTLPESVLGALILTVKNQGTHTDKSPK